MSSSDLNSRAPLAIGGVGGSGTRVVAEIFRELGYFLGGDLNRASDCLSYTFLFVRPEIVHLPQNELARRLRLFTNAMTEAASISESDRQLLKFLASMTVPHGPMADKEWLKDRSDFLLNAHAIAYPKPWGWKEPNTHIVLDRLCLMMPALRYVHVVRNGLDMAFSRNQHQLALWGSSVFNIDDAQGTEWRSLKYWCAVHQRTTAIGQIMGDRFLVVNYDDLCRDPAATLEAICRFAKVPATAETLGRLGKYIQSPSSIGRFRSRDLDVFDRSDIDYVASLGFAT